MCQRNAKETQLNKNKRRAVESTMRNNTIRKLVKEHVKKYHEKKEQIKINKITKIKKGKLLAITNKEMDIATKI